MLRYMKENKGLFLIYVLLVPVAAVCSSLFALCLEPLINVVYEDSVSEGSGFILLAKYALWAVIFALLDMGSHYCLKLSREKLRCCYVAGLRRDLFAGVLRKSVRAFQEQPASWYLSVFNRDVEKLSSCHFDSVCGFYRVTVDFLVSLVLVISINPWIALFNIGSSAVSVWIPRLFDKKLQQKQERASAAAEKYQGMLLDCLRGFTTIRLFGMQKSISARLEKDNRGLEQANYESTEANYMSAWISMLCSQLSFVLTTVLGVYFALKGWMSVGGVVAVSQLIGGIVVPFEELPVHLSNYNSVKGIRRKTAELMVRRAGEQEAFPLTEGKHSDRKLTGRNLAGGKFAGGNFTDRKHAGGMLNSLCLEAVSFSYKEALILRKVSLTLEAGKKYILLGESGSGKSTLAKLAAGFYEADSGTVRLGDRRIEDWPEVLFYRQVTYLEQEVFLFNDTLRQNLTLGWQCSEAALQKALSFAGLEAFVKKLPQGLETPISGNGNTVSGGEKQRIGLARAYLSGAGFLILDEVTAGLDPELAECIEEHILEEAGLCILLITHRRNRKLLEKCDKVFRMEQGILSEVKTD